MSLSAASFNLYLDSEFLDGRTCGGIIAELANVPHHAATVYGSHAGGSVDEAVRKTIRLAPSAQVVEHITAKLTEARKPIAAHFGIELTKTEEPQFLRYEVGDFFVAHQDGNTGLMLSERERFRKVSVVIFLNRKSDIPASDSYCGGALVFTEWRPGSNRGQYSLNADAGTIVAFPAETTHEVTPVTAGERYSIVSWYG
jgi:predicted 2-oxoglutarate/Fe(II)-dependent dioxygenase YbiX